MTTKDRRTKDELLEELAATQSMASSLLSQLDTVDGEAQALAACIAGLDRLELNGVQNREARQAIARVLDHLAGRYGVAELDVRHEEPDLVAEARYDVGSTAPPFAVVLRERDDARAEVRRLQERLDGATRALQGLRPEPFDLWTSR